MAAGFLANKWLLWGTIGGIGVFSTAIIMSATAPKTTSVAPSMVTAEEERSSGSAVSPARRQNPVTPVSLGGGTVDDQLAMTELNLQNLQREMQIMQQAQMEIHTKTAQQLEELAKQVLAASQLPQSPRAELPPLMRPARPNERFSGEYQSKVSHFKGNRGNGWALSDGDIRELRTVSIASAASPSIVPIPGAEIPQDIPVIVAQNSYMLPAGSRIIAITEQVVSSDHPGYFTSRIVRPEILRGARLICQQGGQNNLRIPVQIVKVIHRDEEYGLSGQVEVGFPGVTGKVNRHYFGRSVPIIANAAITGGFVAWSAQNRGSDRIDTRDAITAEVIGQTLPQIQTEINKFATDRPPTVTVAAGTQFSILLTDKLTVRY